MTTPATILENELNLREADYRDFCKKWILVQHEKFKLSYLRRKSELKNPEHVIRFPGRFAESRDPPSEYEMLEWYWSEGLYCGDIADNCPEEFFGEDYYEWMHKEMPDGSDELYQRFYKIFDDSFREVMPSEFHHVLEG